MTYRFRWQEGEFQLIELHSDLISTNTGIPSDVCLDYLGRRRLMKSTIIDEAGASKWEEEPMPSKPLLKLGEIEGLGSKTR